MMDLLERQLRAEIERLQEAKRRALAIADERSKENVALRKALEEARLQLEFLNEKEGRGTTEAILARVRAALGAVGTPAS